MEAWIGYRNSSRAGGSLLRVDVPLLLLLLLLMLLLLLDWRPSSSDERLLLLLSHHVMDGRLEIALRPVHLHWRLLLLLHLLVLTDDGRVRMLKVLLLWLLLLDRTALVQMLHVLLLLHLDMLRLLLLALHPHVRMDGGWW